MSAQKTIYEKLLVLQQKAIAKYSNYKVACIIDTDIGEIEGFNIESAVLPLSMCAERNVIACAHIKGAKIFKTLYLITDSTNDSGTPCGACRQLIAENFDKDAIVYVFNKLGKQKKYKVCELLPFAFSDDSFSK